MKREARWRVVQVNWPSELWGLIQNGWNVRGGVSSGGVTIYQCARPGGEFSYWEGAVWVVLGTQEGDVVIDKFPGSRP